MSTPTAVATRQDQYRHVVDSFDEAVLGDCSPNCPSHQRLQARPDHPPRQPL